MFAWLSKLLPKQYLTADEITAVWNSREGRTLRRLGTFKDAIATSGELEDKGLWPSGTRDVLENLMFTSDKGVHAEVGDPDDVHHLIPPRGVIGFAIEECPDGYSLEIIETRHTRLVALRRQGKLLGATRATVVRMESYGNTHVI